MKTRPPKNVGEVDSLQARLAAAERAKEVMAEVLGETSDRLSDAEARAERLAGLVEACHVERRAEVLHAAIVIGVCDGDKAAAQEALDRAARARRISVDALSPEAPLDRAAGGQGVAPLAPDAR